MVTEAQKRAMKKYREKQKGNYNYVSIYFPKTAEEDYKFLEERAKLETSGEKSTYLKKLLAREKERLDAASQKEKGESD